MARLWICILPTYLAFSPPGKTPFHVWFEEPQPRYAQKWSSYLEVYDRYLSKFRNSSCSLLELGVQSGGSQLMWRDYLGPKSHIYGIDIEPAVTEMSQARITNFIGDVRDPAFLTSVCERIGHVDAIVDDASHVNWHQKLAFEVLYPCLEPNGGIYIVEDIGTSYKPGYGGGWRSEDSFVEFAKAKIDELQAFWSCSGSVVSDRRGRCQQGALEVPISSFTRSSSAIHIHDGLIVFEKHYKEPAISLETGLKRLPKRFEGYSAYRPHLADWTPPEGSCKVPQPFELDIIHESFRSRANQTFSEHVESFMNHVSAMGAAELRQKCGEIMSVLQDGLHWSAFGMDFTLLQLKRRSVSVEWNASMETPLARFLRSTERDVREVLDWYFDKRGTFHPLVLVDLIYRNRWRPTPQALRFARARDALQLQREGFVRFEDFGLDLAWLQTEASAAFAASASTSLVQAKQVRLQSLEPLLKDYGILELTAFYLGADVEVTGYKLLRVREGTTRADYISSFWHHDNCGSRLKLFVFLQDVGEDGYYTEIARGSQSLAYYWYGPAHMSRFDDASVEASFSIEKILSRRGGGFLFDTNTIHRAKVEGPGQLRDAVIVELANAHKMHAGIPAQGPCPEPKTYKVSHVSFPFPSGRGFRQRRPGF